MVMAMEYEKKYKEALERAREALNDGTISSNAIVYLQDIFPELVESEDERIRKAIINTIEDCSPILSPEVQKRMIAWLEKQAPKQKWSEEDEKNWCGIIDEIEANKSTAPIHDIETYDRFLSWMDNIKQRMGGEE